MAIAYPDLVGPVAVGDHVVLNTTAVGLGLGTGGVHLVMAVEGREDGEPAGPGHEAAVRTPTVRPPVEEAPGPSSKPLRGCGARRWCIPLHPCWPRSPPERRSAGPGASPSS